MARSWGGLLKESLLCPLCRHTEAGLRYRLSLKRVFWCRSCLTFFVDPFPKDEELKASYEEASSEFQRKYFESFRDLRARSFARGLRILEELGRRGRLLDVGTGLGFFLDQARKAGWEAECLEVSEKTAHSVRQTLKLPVHVGTLESVSLEKNRYQVVTLWDVLEHLPDPKQTLSRVRDRLVPGGVVVIRTPVCDSLIPGMLDVFYRASFGKFRFGFEKLFKEHLFHFSEKGLCRLVSECGFRILKAYREDYMDIRSLHQKGWAGNLFVRCGAWVVILAAHLIRRQDEVVLYAEISS